jgi:transposase
MKAYSVDFRQKIVDTYFNEKISIAKLAKRFCVAKSFVQKIIKQWRETGDLNPRIPSGGQKLKLSQSQLIIVGDWVNEKNDITLEKIQQRLEEEEKVKVSLSTICRLLESLNLSRKKKHSMPANGIQIGCKS